MVRLSSLAIIGTVFRGGDATDDFADICPSAPEIVLVQDSSNSLKQVGAQIASNIAKTIVDWKKGFPGNVKIGMVSFTDKPLPMRGWGHQRFWTEYADGAATDTCYDFGTGLTLDEKVIEKSFTKMAWRMGGDLPEAQYEALFNSMMDPKMAWTPRETEVDAEGRKITRIAVVITDDISHKSGDAFSGIAHYNAPFAEDYSGGWCSPGLSSFPASVYISVPSVPEDPADPWSEARYKKLVGLCRKMSVGQELNEKEKKGFEYYADIFGPKSVPQVPQHPGTFVVEKDCSTTDYVQFRDVKKALDKTGVLPVFMVTINGNKLGDKNRMNPVLQSTCIEKWGFEADENKKIADPKERLRCIKTYYENELKEHNIDGIVESFEDENDVVKTLKTIVLKAADHNCKTTTTSSTEESSTKVPPVVPPPPVDGAAASGGGSNVGVIAGAAGGAVAGAAVLAGILYKTIGGGMFGGNKTPDLDTMEQVETPDSPVEREAMEEVTIDMFQ